jgi:tetratricopeptide (TPR) repeat protein
MVKKTSRKNSSRAAIGCLGVILLFSGASVRAQSGSGGYAAPYLGADLIQTLSDWTSPLVNPALTANVNQMHMDIGLYRYAVGDGGLGYQEGTFLLPLLRDHTIGLTALWAGGGINPTNSQGEVDASVGSNYSDFWLIPSYGFRVAPWLLVGANLKLEIENQFGPTLVSTPGLDLGIYLNPFDSYRDLIGDLGISIALQDVVPTTFGSKISGTDSLSSQTSVNRARFGVRWSGLNDNLVVDGELVVDNALVSLYKGWGAYKSMFQDSAGVGSLVAAVRGGVDVKYMFIPAIWVKAGLMNNNVPIPYIGFNWNTMWLLPEWINHADFDFNLGYSVFDQNAAAGASDRGFTTMFKIGADFGRSREQVLSKSLYDVLIIAPMDAYGEAMRLYAAGKYWDAGFKFGEVLALFPTFESNDRVKWYLADCYTKLQMGTIARQVLKEALEEYTTSGMRPKYIFGLERLDYQEGKYDDALKNYSFVTSLFPESDIRSEADYLAGEIQFQRKNYNVAEQLLSRLKRGDPSYLYAQYTLSVINIENNKIDAAIGNLSTIAQDSTLQGADQLLADAANLKLGHLYFENAEKMKNGLKQAARCYQKVPEESPYRDEAVLGIAWTLIKAGRTGEAKDAINYIIASLPESPLIPEAYLIRGYALMEDKNYADAVTALDQCLAACKRPFVNDSALAQRKAANDDFVKKFAPVEERIKKNSLRKPTNKTIEDQEAMDRDFQGYVKESHDYFTYTLLAKSHARFFKRKDEVMADAEYALAKATSMLKSQNLREKVEQQQQEHEKIEKQKQQLQEEIEKLKNKQGN